LLLRRARPPAVVWITEVWQNEASHHDSLQLPSVRDAIAKAMPLIAGFEPAVVTDPVGGVGLPSDED
jgi:quinol monooxygenase YgiN